jgi:hypothetical protein
VGVDVSVSVAATRANTECDEGLMQRGNKLCLIHVHYVHFIGEYNNKDNKDNMAEGMSIGQYCQTLGNTPQQHVNFNHRITHKRKEMVLPE